MVTPNTRHLHFKVSARTAKLIGQENFANAEGAVIELVKNAYDADSNFCSILFDIRQDADVSCVYIVDCGCGMTDSVVEKQWMTIGTDDKLINAKSSKTGRIKSGAKGIGRFALNRLGNESQMLTFPEGEEKGWAWYVDWTTFDRQGITLSDIDATLTSLDHNDLKSFVSTEALSELFDKVGIAPEKFHGTIFKITKLNDLWEQDSIESLFSNLEMLIPSHMSNVFSIYLYDKTDYSKYGKIGVGLYDDYDYYVKGSYDGSGSHLLSVEITRKELNVVALQQSYADVFKSAPMDTTPYTLEDFKNSSIQIPVNISSDYSEDLLRRIGAFDFYFFFIKNTIKDDSDAYSEKKYPYNQINSQIRKHWLKKFGGVKVYRDDFRVRPYGEDGDDWLSLGSRQSQSPGGAGQKKGGFRIRPNQISGSVFISRVQNSAFQDKSSREGIVDNQEFRLFKNLLIRIIEAFEEDRNTIMFSLSQLFKQRHPAEGKAADISRKTLQKKKEKEAKGSNAASTEIETLAEGYESLKNELSDKEAEIRMLRGLASSGIAVASFTHELQSLSKLLIPRTKLLENSLKPFVQASSLMNIDKFDNPYYLLSLIRRDDVKLKQWLDYSLNAIKRNKREMTVINMTDYFSRLRSSWFESLKQKSIDFDVCSPQLSEPVYLKGFEMDLDSIFNNFVTNAVTSLLRTDRDKKISLNWSMNNDIISVEFSDNGTGLASEYHSNPEKIFDAFETASRDKDGNKTGTGMGLFIVKGIIDSYKDSTIKIGNITDGFSIILNFKQYKSDIQ